MYTAFQNFVLSVDRTGFRKKGRPPKFSANQFYPYGLEKDLRRLLEEELLRQGNAMADAAVAGLNMNDDSAALDKVTPDFGDAFQGEVKNIADKVGLAAQKNFVNFTDMVVGKPYFPPGTARGTFDSWNRTFMVACKTASESQKNKIAAVLAKGNLNGTNGKEDNATLFSVNLFLHFLHRFGV